MDKRCWTMIHCDLYSKCQMPLNPETNGMYQPTNVGEHCHHFQPIKPSDRGVADELAEFMGALT